VPAGIDETPADLAALLDLLDGSAAQAGARLRRIIIPERRRSASKRALASPACACWRWPRCRPGSGRRCLSSTLPREGVEWESFLNSGVVYARIDAEPMFTFHLAEARAGRPPVWC
jgi:hypothetical protein